MISECCGAASLRRLVAGLAVSIAVLVAQPVAALQITQFKQAVAETAAENDGLSAFYRARSFDPIWTIESDLGMARRTALLGAVGLAKAHGLPAGKYRAEDILALMRAARSERDRGRIEVELSRMLVNFAQDLQTGVLIPSRVDANLVREVPRQSAEAILEGFAEATEPTAFLRALAPRSPEYGRLLREKLKLERRIALGGWGPKVPTGKLTPGSSGNAVVALRNRLIAMGYLQRTPTKTYDDAMIGAVRAFQDDHALDPDGTAGGATIEAINVGPQKRLASILVAMERERWLPADRGVRHVWVNLTDFKARIIDRGEITFETRSVIGKHEEGRRTPEFSDVMEYMVINPSWYVPRSITVNEYLPVLRKNPSALSYLQVIDRNGREVSRSTSFSKYTAQTFPFSIRQPPSSRNALGLVKFMFPNKYNIYLHDTPAKSLFSRTVRAFSHGCIRLNEPFEFAYALLAVQTDTPKSYFDSILHTGRETRVRLDKPVPIHLVYRTAYTKPRGGMQYRADVYGRDARILAALRRAGVDVPPVSL